MFLKWNLGLIGDLIVMVALPMRKASVNAPQTVGKDSTVDFSDL
jgi:hypothetical protein